MFDIILNINTSSDSRAGERLPLLSSENKGVGTIDYINLLRLVRIIKPSADDVIFDIGCGRGRLMCAFARQRVKRVVGVEIVDQLGQKALDNAEHLRGRRSQIEIIQGDALDADLSSGTIYLLFNPFGEMTLRKVVDKIRRSLVTNPRSVTVAYYHPVYEQVLREAGWLKESERHHMLGDYSVSLWKS